jgi:hypothetical protein
MKKAAAAAAEAIRSQAQKQSGAQPDLASSSQSSVARGHRLADPIRRLLTAS